MTSTAPPPRRPLHTRLPNDSGEGDEDAARQAQPTDLFLSPAFCFCFPLLRFTPLRFLHRSPTDTPPTADRDHVDGNVHRR
jgi:hypothetical protein